MKSAFKALLYGDFTPTEEDRRLHELAKQYHKEAEAYDQIVCSGKSKSGAAMPVDAYELRLINRNALKILNRIRDENPDIDRIELSKAIRMHAN